MKNGFWKLKNHAILLCHEYILKSNEACKWFKFESFFFFSLSLTHFSLYSLYPLSLSAAFSSRRVLFSNDKNLSINFIFSSLKIWVCQLFCIPGKFLFFSSAILSSPSSSPQQSRSNPSMDPLFWCLNLFLAYKKVSTAQKMWLKFLTF